jgi:hypothetical protein
MGLIKRLKTDEISVLTNITDAEYENDPNGTDANSLYFIGNVHNFMKHLGIALQPENTKYVSEEFVAGTEDLEDPFYADIQTCYSAFTGTSSSNKGYMLVYHKASSYSDSLIFDSNGYIIIEGSSKYGTVISGNIQVKDGIHVFRNIKFTGTITVIGGTVLFENCLQTAGTTGITSGSTVIVSKAEHWGVIQISAGLSGVSLWCEDILNMNTVEGPGGGTNSIIIPDDLDTPEIILRRVASQGTYYDPGELITEVSGFEENISVRPII